MFLSNDYNEIVQHVNGNLPRPDGFQVLLKIFTPNETTEGGLLLADKTRKDETYRSIVGLVLDKGPVAFKKLNKEINIYEEWHKCEIGDWVIFRPNAGSFFKYRDIPMQSVSDERDRKSVV